MLNTGERYLPDLDGAVISYEHWHRYCIASQFIAGKRVLDIAAGEGYGSDLLARSAAEVIGIDLDAEAVAHARVKYLRDNLQFQTGSAAEIPISGQHLFDVIVSFETIEHLTSESQHRFAAEIRRLLKPDGLLLMSTPDRLIYTVKNQHNNPYHLQEFSVAEFSAFLGGYFSEVRLLRQRVYPCSYIWDPAEAPTRYTEYQLELSDGELQPVRGDHKENLYVVAICSNGPIAAPGNSLLVDLAELATSSMSMKPQGFTSTLFVDTGDGFKAEERTVEKMPAGPGEFKVTFVLKDTVVRGLRWDPIELRTCRLRIDSVRWTDLGGVNHQLDSNRLAGNGELLPNGLWEFDTLDPMVFLPITGGVTSVTVEGWLEADDLATSLTRVDRYAQTSRACVLNRDEQLRERDRQIRERDEQLRERDRQIRERDQQLRAQASAEELARRLTTTLFLDTGDGFQAEQCVSEVMPPGPGRFRLDFNLDGAPVRALRWDPLEYRTCRLRLDWVGWKNMDGVIQSVELNAVAGNGQRTVDGTWEFETLDPMVFLPIAGAVAQVMVSGWYEADDLCTSLCRVDSAAQTAKVHLRERDEQIRALTERLQSAGGSKHAGSIFWSRSRVRA